MTLEERVARLERQNRILRWTITAAAGVVALGFLMGQAKPEPATAEAVRRVVSEPIEVSDLIRTRRLEVIGPGGEPIVSLGMTTSGAGTVSTFNDKGRHLVVLGATTNGEGVVTTLNGKEQELIKLSSTPAGEGIISTFNTRGQKLLGLGVNTEGKPLICTFKPDGQIAATWP